MLPLFWEYPLVGGISFVLSAILVFYVEDANPRLGEMLGTNMIFPFIFIGIMAVIAAIMTFIKVVYRMYLPSKKEDK